MKNERNPNLNKVRVLALGSFGLPLLSQERKTKLVSLLSTHERPHTLVDTQKQCASGRAGLFAGVEASERA